VAAARPAAGEGPALRNPLLSGLVHETLPACSCRGFRYARPRRPWVITGRRAAGPGVLVAQYNPYQQQLQQQALQRQQQGLLLSQLGVLLAMTGALIAIFAGIAARARKKKQEQEEAEQRQRDAQRRRAEEGERRGNS